MNFQGQGPAPDGTQAPSPQPMHPDPLAGLITGEATNASFAGTDSSDFDVAGSRGDAAEPESVNELIRAAFDDDPLPEGNPHAGERPSDVSTERDRQQEAAGRRSGSAAQRTLAGAGQQAKRVLNDGPTRTSSGVAVAGFLLLLFGMLAIAMLVSLASSLS